MNRRSFVFALTVLSATAPVFAIFGVGDVVFDPTNFEESLRQLVQLEQQYEQLVRTYEVISSQYDQMIWMARQVPVNMAARYRVHYTPWQRFVATDTYGEAARWIEGINTGRGLQGAYSTATEPLSPYGSALSSIPSDQLPRVKTDYATVELTDGANLSAMETIGQLRGNASLVESTIQNLEDDSLSADPAQNTEVAILNKINAAHLITVRNTQDTNRLLVSVAEGQILNAKRQRDAEARAIKTHVRFMADARAAIAAQAAGTSSAMREWRMP